MTKSRFVQVLNLIGLEGGANFLDQSHDEVKQNQSNHRLISTLNSKILYCMLNATLKIKTGCSNIFEMKEIATAKKELPKFYRRWAFLL